MTDGDVARSSVNDGEKVVRQQMEPQFGFLLNSVDGNGTSEKRSITSCQQLKFPVYHGSSCKFLLFELSNKTFFYLICSYSVCSYSVALFCCCSCDNSHVYCSQVCGRPFTKGILQFFVKLVLVYSS